MIVSKQSVAKVAERALLDVLKRGIMAARKGDTMGRVGVGLEVQTALKKLQNLYFGKN